MIKKKRIILLIIFLLIFLVGCSKSDNLEEKEDTVKKSEQNDIVKPDQRDLVIRPKKSAETVQENHKPINEDKPENIKESK